MRSTSRVVSLVDDWKKQSEQVTGFMRPNPPSLAGRAKIFLSTFELAGLPESEEINS